VSEIVKALSKVQSQLCIVEKDRTNPHFKSRYATLEAIIEAASKVLPECGLAVSQTIEPQKDLPGAYLVKTTLMHVGGEKIESYCPAFYEATGRNPAQSFGSGVTYARRYSLAAILNLGQEDDDGNSVRPPVRDAQPTASKPLASGPKVLADLDAAKASPLEFVINWPGTASHGKKIVELTVDTRSAMVKRLMGMSTGEPLNGYFAALRVALEESLKVRSQ